MRKYQICKRCVMDTSSDEQIRFDENGYCSYCTDALDRKSKVYFPNKEGEKKLNDLVNRLKKENKNKKFDCIMGISGGLDSSYLAYLGSIKWDLRILAIHVDDGYDTEVSTRNIKNLCEKCKIKLVVVKPDAYQFNELTRAYVLSGVPNLAAPQDNVLFACVYKFMKEHKIRTFLSGGNFSLESILQVDNTHDAYDLRNIKDINKKHGRGKINKLTLISNFQRDFDAAILKIESPRPLNYIDYNRNQALNELYENCGFEYYGSKHLENTLTKFIQVYWFYNKFNVDKRKSHLSSMIISNQMDRTEALKELEKPLYNADEIQGEIDYILKKLDISRQKFNEIMRKDPNSHSNFKTSRYIKLRKPLLRLIRFIKEN